MANYFEASMLQIVDVGKGSKRKLLLDVIIPLALELERTTCNIRSSEGSYFQQIWKIKLPR